MGSAYLISIDNLITLALILVPTFIFLDRVIKKLKQPKKSLDDLYSVKLPPPPGPKTLPLIGHMHLISSVPFRSFRDLAEKYGPVVGLKVGQVPMIVISSPEIAKDVLKEQDPTFAERPESVAMRIIWYNFTNIAFSPYGDYWRQMRKICILELLSSKMVRSFGSIRNVELSRLMESIKATSGKPFNFTQGIFSMTSTVSSRAAFGKVCKNHEALIDLLMEASRMGAAFEIGDLFPSSKIAAVFGWISKVKMMRMRRKVDAILDDIIFQHRKNLATYEHSENMRKGNGEFGNEDLVDVLLRLMESGELQIPIDDDNIKAVVANMFSGGAETSAATIDWTMVELLRNPEVMGKAQAEVREALKGVDMMNMITQTTDVDKDIQNKLPYLKLIIKESLRLHPPIPLLPRLSRTQCKINGYTFPPKTRIVVNNWALQRDPKYWADPESFSPERFLERNSPTDFMTDFHYIPFGAGRRMCPGLTSGLASVELTLAHLLYNFNWALPNGVKPQDLNMIEIAGVMSPRKEQLYVVATPSV